MLKRSEVRKGWQRCAAVLMVVLTLAACGGGDDAAAPAAPTPASGLGTALVGAAGGTVRGAGGAQVSFPPNALEAEVTVRIAKDGTGAPPLPAVAEAAGAVYTITPHGGGFAAHAEVVIPVEHGPLAENEQLLLLTASPGDTGWRALSGASYSNGAMRAPVAHFSFFQVVVIRDIQVPRLYVSVDNRNNEGSDGMTAMSPTFEFGTSPRIFEPGGFGSSDYQLRYVAKLRYARPPVLVNILPAPRPTNCAPTSYGKDGAKWYFERNGREPITPLILQRNLVDSLSGSTVYPRTEDEAAADRYTTLKDGINDQVKPGFGAIHFYAQSNPRRGSYIDRVALPPANNVIDDDVLTWRGDATLEATPHNGRHRVDVWVPTVCGFSIEAVPLLYRVNLTATGSFGFQGLNSSGDVEAAAGARATLNFEMLGGNALDPATLRWEFSTDRLNWQGRALPAGVRAAYPAGFDVLRGQVFVDAARADQTGFYRAYACNYSFEGSTPTCVSGVPVALTVVTAAPSFAQQPQGTVVQVGETASFTAVPAGAPAPALQWQKRSIVAAAFNYDAWTNIPGATSNTLTLPAVSLADGATQFRVVATNELAVVASDGALLTVVDQFVPPAITSQPGNLNVVVGGTAVFAGTATGSAPLSYQWLKNGVPITGANTPALTLPAVAAADAARYELAVSNRAGSVRSEPAALVVTQGTPVALAPTIAAPPASVSVSAGQAAQFAVAVNGTGPYTYLWSKDRVQIPGGDGASFGIAATTLADAGDYTVRVTNNAGTVLSTAARLTVTAAVGVAPTPPAITTQPAGLAVLPGGGATLAVGYTGSGPFTFQWRRNGADISGATGAVLTLAAVNATDAGQYAVTVRNAAGVADSSTAQLIVIGAPAIQQQPVAVAASEGANATFSVVAIGDGLRYLWLRNGLPVAGAPGAATAQLTVPALSLADSGAAYSVVVFNGAGAVVSSPAVLSVVAAGTAPGEARVLAGAIGSAGRLDAPSGPATTARLAGPSWLARDAAGNLYVTEDRNLDVRKITPSGQVTTLAAVPAGPQGLAVDAAGNVYVAALDHTIKRITPAGAVSVYAGAANSPGWADASTDPLAARFDSPHGLAIGGGYLYVADSNNHAIRRISLTTGTVDTLARGDPGINAPVDGCFDSATLSRPIGITANDVGFIFWTEENNTIRLKGECVSTVAGIHNPPGGYADGTGEEARFNNPTQIALEASGDLYVADASNQVIRKIETRGVSRPGIVTTVFGRPGVDSTAPGVEGSVAYPFGVVVIGNQLRVTSNLSHVVLGIQLP